MFSTRFIAAAAASLSLMSSVTADYNPLSQANVAMYYVWKALKGKLGLVLMVD
tara:strand:+ start:807 stop:965 length:159 start_codon:yes stop_codon:yes gene_type:complete